jgi:hypothetical protein
MTWLSVVGLISSIALFLPILIILILRLAWYKSFPALLIYYVLLFAHSILSLNFVHAGKDIVSYFALTINFLDAPLMLAFMTYFSRTASFRKKMKLAIPVFIIFELVIIAIYGFNRTAVVIVLGPGLLMILILSLIFFIHQAKITVVHQKAAGKAFIASSLLFAYGGYSFVYVVHFLLTTPHREDTLLVYYLIVIFSSMLLATGIFMERRRVKQLNELKVAREELKVIYGGS